MRILLAEDEHSLGTWLSRALEHAGIQVEWVTDGRLADRALQQSDYDALVLPGGQINPDLLRKEQKAVDLVKNVAHGALLWRRAHLAARLPGFG